MDQIVKRVLRIGAGLCLVFGIIMAVVWSNLEWVIKTMIETIGSKTLGTQVHIESVFIDMNTARLTLTDLRVDNPEGFSDEAMLYFSRVSADFSKESLEKGVISIAPVRIFFPKIVYEMKRGESNFDFIQKHAFTKVGSSSDDQNKFDEKSPRFSLSKVIIQNPRVTILAPEWGKNRFTIEIPTITTSFRSSRFDRQKIGVTGQQLARNFIDQINSSIKAPIMDHVE